MPEPQPHPNLPRIKRVAFHALLAGLGLTGLKFAIFFITGSVAVLSDALESIINLLAAAMMIYSIWYGSRPPDPEHPYGHGNIEVLAVGFEGLLILVAGVMIAYEAIARLIGDAPELRLGLGLWLLGGMGLLMAGLAAYVWRAGKRYNSAPLIADGRHLATDVFSTIGVLIGLILVRLTGWDWLDPAVALIMAGLIFWASWDLLGQSFHGLMDRADPEDEQRILAILDEEVARGTIRGYHKVRHRHTGFFHWVDMHLQVRGQMSVAEGHDLATHVEKRIEKELGHANATAHIEPHETEARRPMGSGDTV
ncbi:MAG: cation diffusion facilitator family transporter [Phycisphaeraceae bacterium]